MTTEPLFKISSVNELRALHLMLMRRKFDGPADECFGSPYIASIQHRLVEALEQAEGDRWVEWRQAAAHPTEVEVVRKHLIGETRWFATAAKDDQERYVRDLLAPLIPSPELLAELIGIGSGSAI